MENVLLGMTAMGSVHWLRRCKMICVQRTAVGIVWAVVCALVGQTTVSWSADWFVSPTGSADGQGTKQSPWDLTSALEGKHPVAPGDTVWIAGGTYKHPDRTLGSPGYVVRLAGQEGKPVHVRAMPAERVTLDGGLTVQSPANWLWVWDLEILVSENFTMPRRVEEPGSHPQSYNRPWGGLNIHAGQGCKYINLVIHDNAQGVSFWTGATDSELHGCLIYDNGWDAPDRGHGHAIYTQNQTGVKVISDCIMTGGYSYTMHAYGSSRAYVDNYLIEGNVAYHAGTFLIGGGRPSRGIRVLANLLYGVPMQIGYTAPENEDCVVRDNVIVNASLSITRFKHVVNEGNLVLGARDPRPMPPDARVVLRPNRYDPDRANLVIFNWARKPAVEVGLAGFVQPGEKFRLQNPRDFFGPPVLSGTFRGQPVSVPVEGEFAALVVLRGR